MDIREQLAARGLAPNKRFGQNFLIDGNILDAIIDAADLSEDDTVLEIGPGTGALTDRLADRAARLVAVEIDRGLAELLNDRFADNPRVEILHADILKTDLSALFARETASINDDPDRDRGNIKVVANLPYYITTPILLELLPKRNLFSRFVVMMQREVADRMQAGPGSKDYGALSLAVQYYAAPEIVTLVPPGAFYPPPEVTSAVLRLDRHERPPVTVRDPEWMFKLISAAFGKRRKTLANAVSGAPQLGLSSEQIREALRNLQIDPAIRGEALSLTDYAALSDLLF